MLQAGTPASENTCFHLDTPSSRASISVRASLSVSMNLDAYDNAFAKVGSEPSLPMIN